MKSKCAEHLTMLLVRSAPITMALPPEPDVATEVNRDGYRNPTWSHPSLEWQEIRDIIHPIAESMLAAAQDEEIRRAARERRPASGYVCHVGYASSHSVAWHPYGGYAMILWDMCASQIATAIGADDARRLAEYEAYRQACEQGVALPPS
jgi:hypothetical protein